MKKVTSFFEKNWKLFVLVFIAFFNFFFLLGSFPVYDWDEAWYGVSSYEMIENKDFIINTFMGIKDFFNTKPPLGLWFIALAYKIFGTNIFALRFFSALSGFLAVIVTYKLAKKLFGEKVGLFSGIFLALSRAFLDSHSGRTGDFDAMFSLFFILTAWILTIDKESFLKWCILGVLMGLSFLLKGFAFLQVALMIFAYYILKNKFKFINYKIFSVIGVFFILVILPWILLRYNRDGFEFFKVMIERDFFGRGFGRVDGRTDTNFLYIRVILVNNLFWIIFAFFTLFWKNKIYFKKDENNFLGLFHIKFNEFFRKEIIWAYLIGSLLLPFLMTSKSSWYVNSFYPLLAMMAAWFVAEIWDKYKLKYWISIFILLNWAVIWVYIIFRPIKGWYIPENKKYQPMLINFIKENKVEGLLIDKEMTFMADGRLYWNVGRILPSELFIVKTLCHLKKVKYPSSNSILLVKNKVTNNIPFSYEEMKYLLPESSELITNTLDHKWFVIKIK